MMTSKHLLGDDLQVVEFHIPELFNQLKNFNIKKKILSGLKGSSRKYDSTTTTGVKNK